MRLRFWDGMPYPVSETTIFTRRSGIRETSMRCLATGTVKLDRIIEQIDDDLLQT